MPAPTSAAEFLALTQRSTLVPAGTLDGYRDSPPFLELTAADAARQLVVDGLLSPFQANHLLKGKFKNFFIGKYKVIAPLGSGGASQVFLCEHGLMRHRVAIKILRLKDANDPAALNRFRREARAAASVNHPNVVRAFDFDQAEGKHYYMVLDYVDGVSLQHLVERVGPLPPHQAVHYVVQAASGLQHIDDCGLIHRDIKPSNLLLDRTGVIRILDLGLVRFTEPEDDNLTKTQNDHAVLGTADYLSPEQALKADDLDVRSDIYSLGATLYFLLAGRTPFADLNIAQKLLHHQFKEPPPVAGVPKDLFAVLRTMMAKKPGDRYQTPAEVVEALDGWTAVPLPPPDASYFEVTEFPIADTETPSAASAPTRPSLRRVVRPARRKLLLPALIVTAVLLTGLVAFFALR